MKHCTSISIYFTQINILKGKHKRVPLNIMAKVISLLLQELRQLSHNKVIWDQHLLTVMHSNTVILTIS